MKRILIPTPLFHQNESASQQMLDFIALMKSHIHVYFLSTYFVSAENAEKIIEANDEQKDKSQRYLAEIKQKLKSQYHFDENKISLISEIGNLSNVVPRLLKKLSIDILVLDEKYELLSSNVYEKINLQDPSCSIIKIINPKR